MKKYSKNTKIIVDNWKRKGTYEKHMKNIIYGMGNDDIGVIKKRINQYEKDIKNYMNAYELSLDVFYIELAVFCLAAIISQKTIAIKKDYCEC